MLHRVILAKNWGDQMREGDAFYRMLFNLDKKKEQSETISNLEINILFTIYKKWFTKTDELLRNCNEENFSNREAHAFGNKLKQDIISHVHTIINENTLETAEFISNLRKFAESELTEERAIKDSMEHE